MGAGKTGAGFLKSPLFMWKKEIGHFSRHAGRKTQLKSRSEFNKEKRQLPTLKQYFT